MPFSNLQLYQHPLHPTDLTPVDVLATIFKLSAKDTRIRAFFKVELDAEAFHRYALAYDYVQNELNSNPTQTSAPTSPLASLENLLETWLTQDRSVRLWWLTHTALERIFRFAMGVQLAQDSGMSRDEAKEKLQARWGALSGQTRSRYLQQVRARSTPLDHPEPPRACELEDALNEAAKRELIQACRYEDAMMNGLSPTPLDVIEASVNGIWEDLDEDYPLKQELLAAQRRRQEAMVSMPDVPTDIFELEASQVYLYGELFERAETS